MADSIVLVHGAWAAGWVWDPIIEGLQKAGLHVFAPTLPGQTDATDPRLINLQTYVDFLIALIEAKSDAPACLVGHSGSGVVISQVAEARPDLIESLVYVAGFMLPTTTTFTDLCNLVYGPGIAVGASLEAELDEHTGWVSLRTDNLHKVFFNCIEPSMSAPLIKRLCPHPITGWTLTNTLSEQRFGSIPRHYVRLGQDNSVPAALQDKMLELTPGAVVHRIETDHVPQVSSPRKLTECLLEICQ